MLRIRQLVDQPALLGLGLFLRHPRRHPADVEQRRLGLSDIARNAAVTHRQPRLPLQLVELLLHLRDDVVDPL
jgi:hypothetical protein